MQGQNSHLCRPIAASWRASVTCAMFDRLFRKICSSCFIVFFLPFDPTPPHKNIFDLQDVCKGGLCSQTRRHIWASENSSAHRRPLLRRNMKLQSSAVPASMIRFLIFPMNCQSKRRSLFRGMLLCSNPLRRISFLDFFCMRNGGMTYCMNRWFTVEFGFNIL